MRSDGNVTVISGMLYVGVGDQFDESKGQAVNWRTRAQNCHLLENHGDSASP